MHFKFAHKLQGQSLYFVIAVSTVIAILLSGIILLSSVYLNASSELDLKRKLIWNNKSALNYCFAHETLPRNILIDLFGNERDSVAIITHPYGLFYKLNICSFHGSDSVSKTYLLGKKNKTPQKTALYLKNSNKPLGVCGETKIKGDLTVSNRGVERSYIEGQSYVGRKLYYGKKMVSKNSIPQLQNSSIDAIEYTYTNDEDYKGFDTNEDSIVGGLNQVNLRLDAKTLITQYIRGMVIIKSSQQIVLSSSSNIRDCIIVAPSIIVESGFEGSFQGFATDSIILGENCVLKSPSNLVLQNKKTNNSSAKIIVGGKSEINGNIALLQNMVGMSDNGIITIHKNTIVNGEVYGQSTIELKECAINGTVISNDLYLKTASSVYMNQLLNVVIDVSKLNPNHIGLGIDNSHKVWEVLK